MTLFSSKCTQSAAPAVMRGSYPAPRRAVVWSSTSGAQARTCLPLSQPSRSRSQYRCAVRAASAPESVATVEEVDERLPVTIITGFLGSGKTTLLNHILTQKHGKRIAIIENEFGEVGIDNDLIVAREDVDGASLTILENGCLCCVVLGDLAVALKRLHERREQFDHVVIETTGLANPAPIISTLFMDESLPKMVRLDGVCTVVDAKHVSRHLDAANREDGRSNEAIEQLAYADRIVINKRDLVSTEALDELTDRIRAMNAMASMRTALKAEVPVEYVLGIGGFALEEVANQMEKDLARELEEGHSHDHDHDHDHDHEHSCGDPSCSDPSHNHSHAHSHDHSHDGHSHDGHSHSHEKEEHAHAHAHHKNVHDDNVKSASFVIDGDMDLDRVNYWLGALVQMRGDDIYRMKGILAVKDYPERFVFQGVHNLFEGGPDRLWREGEKRQSKMVFIGKDLDMDLLKEGFEDCRAEEA